MEENTNNVKITYAKNLNSINFSATFSSIIDANVNIKNILDVSTYLFETKSECGNGKAVITGKIGIKVLYIDTDNITNIITDNQSFSENFSESSITNECLLNISNHHVSHTILSTEGTLKVSCEVHIKPILYVNLPLNTNSNFENMIVKKSKIETNTINQFINTSFEYTSTFETKDVVSKILYHSAYYSSISETCKENFITVEGKLYSLLVYETQENDETVIKQISDCFNVKTDIEKTGVNNDCSLDLFYVIDKSKENIVTEAEDGNNIVTITNHIKLDGVCNKNISIDVVDDMYSTENELEIKLVKRDYVKTISNISNNETTVGEIALSSTEPAIDNVISNLNIIPEITNYYIKDNMLYTEGVISSNLTYVDENKEYQHKMCEIPFIINTKFQVESLSCFNPNINIVDCKVKIKRGTIIELEYQLCLNCCVYEQISKEIVDSINIGKTLDFTNYDYQIYLTKPNETMWELCKRIKTTPENIIKNNKNLPTELIGNEKIIVKR